MRPDHINPDGYWFDKERWTRTLRYWKHKTEMLMRASLRGEDRDAETAAERTPYWTPIPRICLEIEVSHSALSRAFRELMGLNVIQFYDKLKLVETGGVVRYIALLTEFVNSLVPNAKPPYQGNGSKHFWKWLKLKRNNPDFDRQALAREFDFPSAARLHRALFFATNSTPREFENMIIRLAIENPQALEQTRALYAPKTTPNASPKPVPQPVRAPLPIESTSVVKECVAMPSATTPRAVSGMQSPGTQRPIARAG